jgi:ectoine hydroxylase-related dioxygenase (phytanoyl-CoA dioxygenase family)
MPSARGFEKIHDPITDAFPRLSRRADLAPFEPSPADIERFHRDGFIAGISVLDAAQIAEGRRRLDELLRHLRELEPFLYEVEADWLARPGEVVTHFLGAWLVDPWFHDLLFAPQVTVPLARFLGVSKLRFWHDQVFYKPPGHPGVVPWHQDYSYWTRAAPPRHITLNIMLDDVTEANGCVHFVPGSHRFGLLPKVAFGGPMDQVLAHLGPAERAAFKPVPADLAAGQATVHDSFTIHGSFGNPSGRPRRAIVLNYMAPDTRCASASEPLLRGVPLIPEGAVIEGDHFPIVLDLSGTPD